jgi:hypothetical protein
MNRWNLALLPLFLVGFGATPAPPDEANLTYPIVDTGQVRCHDASGPVTCLAGEDARRAGRQPSYRDNGDGTVTDLVTGLMWQQEPGPKQTITRAEAGAGRFALAGHDDWRLPTIKELYSLILFSGTDPHPGSGSEAGQVPFIDTRYFGFSYGDEAAGDRLIDSQFVSATRYVGTTMGGKATVFGVNFADGRIKGYPAGPTPREAGGKLFVVLHVRGGRGYGINDFADGRDGTVTDRATGLVWTQRDSGESMGWEQALTWTAELELGGHSDWRLPDAKELQSLVDYTRAPTTSGSPAIDPVFRSTSIITERGSAGFGSYWTSTTHVEQGGRGAAAVYVSFGEALGWMRDPRTGERRLMDVHGAGAQRSDPKVGDAADFPYGRGPQGDVIRVRHLVRAVRGGVADPVSGEEPTIADASRPDVRPPPQRDRRPRRTEDRSTQDDRPARRTGGRSAQRDEPGERPRPPREATEACDGAGAGDSCSFQGRRGEQVVGTCELIDQVMACVPEGGPPTGPPPGDRQRSR